MIPVVCHYRTKRFVSEKHEGLDEFRLATTLMNTDQSKLHKVKKIACYICIYIYRGCTAGG